MIELMNAVGLSHRVVVLSDNEIFFTWRCFSAEKLNLQHAI